MQITTAPGPVDRTSPFPTAPCQPLLPLSGYYSLDFLSYLSHNCNTHLLPAPVPTLPGRPLSLDSLLAYTTRRPGAAPPGPVPCPARCPVPASNGPRPRPNFHPLAFTYSAFLVPTTSFLLGSRSLGLARRRQCAFPSSSSPPPPPRARRSTHSRLLPLLPLPRLSLRSQVHTPRAPARR